MALLKNRIVFISEKRPSSTCTPCPICFISFIAKYKNHRCKKLTVWNLSIAHAWFSVFPNPIALRGILTIKACIRFFSRSRNICSAFLIIYVLFWLNVCTNSYIMRRNFVGWNFRNEAKIILSLAQIYTILQKGRGSTIC